MMQMAMGGSERLVHNIAANIDREIFNPSIAWFFGENVLPEFQQLEIPLYHLPKLRRVDFSTMQSLEEVVKKNDVHVVNAHHFMSMVYAYYGCKIKNHIKLIYTEHSRWEIERIPRRWEIIGRHLLKKTDGAVGVSPEVTLLMREKFKLDSSKAVTIQNGVDLFVFKNRKRLNFLRDELGISENDKVIGMVGNLKAVKNHLFLLRAFSKLLKNIDNVKLLLIGQAFRDEADCSEQDIINFIEKNGIENKVLMVGPRSDIPELLNIMDIFCLTSHKEGMPISLIEAMATSLPVVGTDVDGIRDVVRNGENGFVVPLDDTKELEKKLLTLLSDETLRKAMGNASETIAQQNYSLDKCLNQYEKLFHSVKCKV